LDWRDALAANNADELGRLAWERGGDAWYDYAIRVVAPSPFLLDQAAGRVTSPAKAAELRERAQRRREELAREEAARQAWAAAQEAAARRSAQAYYGSSGAFSGSSLSVPALSAQQLEYRATTSLNKAIYGTSWDPYK